MFHYTIHNLMANKLVLVALVVRMLYVFFYSLKRFCFFSVWIGFVNENKMRKQFIRSVWSVFCLLLFLRTRLNGLEKCEICVYTFFIGVTLGIDELRLDGNFNARLIQIGWFMLKIRPLNRLLFYGHLNVLRHLRHLLLHLE